MRMVRKLTAEEIAALDQVMMRLDADVLDLFRSRHAKGYQTRINAILRDYIARHRQDGA